MNLLGVRCSGMSLCVIFIFYFVPNQLIFFYLPAFSTWTKQFKCHALFMLFFSSISSDHSVSRIFPLHIRATKLWIIIGIENVMSYSFPIFKQFFKWNQTIPKLSCIFILKFEHFSCLFSSFCRTLLYILIFQAKLACRQYNGNPLKFHLKWI